MSFSQTHYLSLLFLIPIYAWISRRSFTGNQRWLERLTGEKPSGKRFILSMLLISLSLAAMVAALARPVMPVSRSVFTREGILLVLGIDVSKSMLAEDVGLWPETESDPAFRVWNRLNLARRFALEVIEGLNGEKVGVFIFAGEGIEIVPLTGDYRYGRYILRHINDMEITSPGSSLAAALETGRNMLDTAAYGGAKRMVLITDGEVTEAFSGGGEKAVRDAVESGIRVYTVGVGSSVDAAIPFRSADGRRIRGYYEDESGCVLKTRLDPAPLYRIARETGGSYYSARDPGEVKRLLQAVLENARISEQSRSMVKRNLDVSPFFVLAAILLFIPGVLVEHVRFKSRGGA